MRVSPESLQSSEIQKLAIGDAALKDFARRKILLLYAC
jgi:hypothetical protein